MPPKALQLNLAQPATALGRAAAAGPSAAPVGQLSALLLEARRDLEQQDAERAGRVLARALALAPEQPDVLNLLSVVAGRQGRPKRGEALSRRAVAHNPEHAGYHQNLALRLLEQERRTDALEVLKTAHRLAPRDPAILRLLARSLADAGSWDAATAVAARALACRPEDPETLVVAAKVMALGGRPAEAPALFERAVELAPDRVEWWLDLARVCHKVERLDEGARALEEVIRRMPEHAEARTMLASICFRRRDYDRLEEVLSGLQATGQDAANAINLSGMMMVARGRLREGLEAMALVDELAPQAHELQMTRVMYLNYSPWIRREDLYEEHRCFGLRFRNHVPSLGPFDLDRDPERKLRIGYVSPDFRAHSVAYFAAPVFEAHDRDRFDIVAYAHLHRPDRVSRHLQERVSEWHEITHLDDAALARKIRADRIDVLVDLAGLTASSRLLAFTGRPAPVQISYLGYPNTTGLPQIDYRITDGIADPDDADDLHSESLIRLPRSFLCYAIPEHAPDVAPPPFERNGYVTFGSFNSINKINPEVVALWAEVLQAVPGTRLLMKSLATGDPKAQACLLDAFAGQGIAPERLRLAPYAAGSVEHMSLYNEVDVALDTFPYNGTTTTCEALWMGVPVITLVGDRHPARVSASLLTTIGFTAGIARTAEEYVTTARLMSEHPELIRAARKSLRADLCRSPLCDMHGHARALEEAYRAVFRLWCEEQEAA